jgi:hypothetical protein
MVISTGFDAFFNADSGHVELFAAPAPGTAATADNPVANTTTAIPEPVQRFHDRMSAPRPSTHWPDAGYSMADGQRRVVSATSTRYPPMRLL